MTRRPHTAGSPRQAAVGATTCGDLDSPVKGKHDRRGGINVMQ